MVIVNTSDDFFVLLGATCSFVDKAVRVEAAGAVGMVVVNTDDSMISPGDSAREVRGCCSVLQCVAVCCSVLLCVAACCKVLQSVAECCSVLYKSIRMTM